MMSAIEQMPEVPYVHIHLRETYDTVPSRLIAWLRARRSLAVSRLHGPGAALFRALLSLPNVEAVVGRTDEVDLQHVANLAGLQALVGKIESVELLSSARALRELELEWQEIDPEIRRNFRELRRLEFQTVSSDLSALGVLTRLTKLKMRLSNLYSTSAETTLQPLRHLTELRSLELSLVRPQAMPDLTPIGALRGLRTLKLYLAEHGEAQAFEPIARLSALEELHIYSEAFSDESLALLSPLSSLRELLLRAAVRRLPTVGDLRSLQTLDLTGCDMLENEAMNHVSTLSLQTLRFNNTPLGDPALVPLRRMTSLRNVYVSDGVTQRGRAALQRALPDVVIHGY
ncbi:MAG: hypothetical protein AAF938_25890 [Myxococcota bacterium]